MTQTRTCNSHNFKYLTKSAKSKGREGKKIQTMSHMRDFKVILICNTETMYS